MSPAPLYWHDYSISFLQWFSAMVWYIAVHFRVCNKLWLKVQLLQEWQFKNKTRPASKCNWGFQSFRSTFSPTSISSSSWGAESRSGWLNFLHQNDWLTDAGSTGRNQHQQLENILESETHKLTTTLGSFSQSLQILSCAYSIRQDSACFMAFNLSARAWKI